jgi:hypothetical protein
VEEQPDELDDAEAARRRDEVIKRMLATPPKPHGKGAAPKDGPKRSQAKAGKSGGK